MRIKLIIGIAAAVAITYAFSSPPPAVGVVKFRKDLTGKAVTSASSEIMYKINWQGFKVAYENHQAYLNDGAPAIVILTDEQLKGIGTITNAMIFETGYKTI